MLGDDGGMWAYGSEFGFPGILTEFERELTAEVDVDVDIEEGVGVGGRIKEGADLGIVLTGTGKSIVGVSLACLIVNGGGGGSGAKLTTSGVGPSAPTSPLGTIASIISILAVSVIGGLPSTCVSV